jgi:hypothetical protein
LLWLLIILLVLLALLSVPVDLAYRLHLRAGVEGKLTIGWLFGLVRIPVSIGGEKAGKKSKSKKRAARGKAKRARANRGRAIVTRGEFWQWLRRLLRKLLGRIEIYRLFQRIRLGLGDPADTGRLWALAGPVAAILASIPLADVRIEPNFMDAEFVLESEGQVRVYPIRIIATVVATALSPTTWRVFRQQGRVRR